MTIYARAYALREDGRYTYSEVVKVNLQQLLMAVDAQWNALTTAQREAVGTMYALFEPVMFTWDIPRIKKAFA